MAKKAKAEDKVKMTARDVILSLKQNAKSEGRPGSILMASELGNPFFLRRPSGIISLDLATGGGLPASGLSQISGPEGIGKNYLAYQYAAQCQEIYGNEAAIAVACLEFQLDKDYARKAGMQVAYSDDEIEKIQSFRKAKGLEPLSKKDIKQMQTQLGVLAIPRGETVDVLKDTLEIIASGQFQIVILDSWNAMLPPDDLDKDVGDQRKMAGQASLQTHFMQMYHRIMATRIDGRENMTTLIGIAQVRSNMNKRGPFSREWKTGGSYAVKHGKLVDIELSSGGLVRKSKKPIGKEVNWALKKGKAGCHDGPRGMYTYFFDPPRVDHASDLVAVGLEYGVIERGGAYYTFTDFKGYKKELVELINTDTAVRDALYASILQEADRNVYYKEP